MLLVKREMKPITIQDRIMSIMIEKKEITIENLMFVYYNKFHVYMNHKTMGNYAYQLARKGFLERTGPRKFRVVGRNG